MNEFEKRHKVWFDAQEKAASKILTSYWLEKFYNEDDLLYERYVPTNYIGRKEIREFIARKKKSTWRYVFLTINPRPETTVLEFIKKLKKFANRKALMINYMYCVEQRSPTADRAGEGMHAHFLLEWNTENSQSIYKVIGYARNTFKNLISDKYKVHARYANDKTNFVNYIAGAKKDEVKAWKAEVDKEWRREIGLDDVYVSEGWMERDAG